MFRRNVLSHASATAGGALALFLLVVVLSRVLEVDAFAAWITAMAVVGVAEIACDFGTRVVGLRAIASPGAGAPRFAALLASRLTYSLLTAAAVMALPLPLLGRSELALCALIAMTQASGDPLLWLLQGRERMHVEAAFLLAWRAGYALLLAVLAWAGVPVPMLLAAWLACNLARIGAELALPELRALLAAEGGGRPGTDELRQVLLAAFPIGVAFLLISLLHRLPVLALGWTSTADTVGVYGATFSLVSATGMLATSITLASFPGLARALQSGSHDEASRVLERKIRLVSWIFVPACAAGMWLAPWALHLLYGERFVAATGAMVVLLAAQYLSVVNFALKFALNALERNWGDAAAVLVGIGALAGVMAVAPAPTAAVWAALAWAAGEAVSFVLKCRVLAADSRLAMRWLPHVAFAALLLAASAGFALRMIPTLYEAFPL